MKPQPTLSVSVKLWFRSGMRIWAPFWIHGLSLGVIRNFSEGTGLP